MPDPPPTLWTIGTGHRSLEELLALLHEASIEVLADVRSYPKSHLAHFSRPELERSLRGAGIEYVWMGGDLGGLRTVGYRQHMSSDRFERGRSRLAATAAARRTAICCAEIDPDRCHRRFIADSMAALGWRVHHLVGPGDCRPHRALPGQDDLPFGLG